MKRNIATYDDDVIGILGALPEEKRTLYIKTLYSIARSAINAGCQDLHILDLELLAILDDESNARFEEWTAL